MKRVIFSVLVLAFFAISACKENPQANSSTVEKVVEKAVSAIASQNTLTEDEAKAGFKLLFDGKSLGGWHNFKSTTIGKDWVIDSAEQAIMLKVTQKPDGSWQAAEGGDIMSAEAYENYELQLEWKIDTCGNSGIIYNISADTSAQYVWQSGPEMQVLDNACHPDAKIIKHRAGDLYDLISCTKETVTPALQWNKVKLVQNKGKVEHWLNGEKVVEYDMNKPEWKTLIAKSKFAKMPLFGKGMKGYIALQDHGNKVWYRNIKIRTL